MFDDNPASELNKLIVRRVLAANAPRHVYVQILYSHLDSKGHGAIGLRTSVGVKQLQIPTPMGPALLKNKKNIPLDNLLKM